MSEQETKTRLKNKKTSGARHIKPRRAPHDRMLPPGELKGMMLYIVAYLLWNYNNDSLTVSPQCYLNYEVTKLQSQATENNTPGEIINK